MYTEKVMEYFTKQENVGEIPDADGEGTITSPTCGDLMKVTIRVTDGVLSDVKVKTFGCGAAIASAAMLTELVKGMPVDKAKSVTNMDVAEALGGLPSQKLHCSNLAADALQEAIKDYEEQGDAPGGERGKRKEVPCQLEEKQEA